ncbi:unnamed protein product [Strongylus vulgaris]|uniref:Uncharacterized protein n=1 Tax=Strongylus vulgaris TaxID=40348 RepID=A0A3P7JLM4_STRVU|nr:unnamed protein product [Strongylus vulgaris]
MQGLSLSVCLMSRHYYYISSYIFVRTARCDVFLVYEGDFDAAQYMNAFIEFANSNNIFQRQILFVGENTLANEVERYVQSNKHEFVGFPRETKLFYMTDSQMESITNLEFSTALPTGYKLDLQIHSKNRKSLLLTGNMLKRETSKKQGSADPLKESEIITSYWEHAKEGDVEETRLSFL